MDCGNFTATIGTGILKREFDDAARRQHGNKFDADGRFLVKVRPGSAGNSFDDFLLFGSTLLEFDSGIQIFGVLTNNDHVDIFVARTQALVCFGGAEVSIEIEPFAQCHICAARAFADRGGDRTF